MKVGVYIHIPFCRSICSYCDFCKVLYNKEWVVKYLKKLKEEIIDRYMNEEVSTIYIGGGTPSCLSLKEIEYILILTKLFKKENLEEFTFECNIEDITEDLLELLKKYGVNRLSIGIESFDQTNLALMKRHVEYKDAAKKMALARKIGFDNINIDLMYALPNEKLSTLKKDLKQVLSLEPDHISTYSLIIEDNTYLSYKRAENIAEELDYEMYEYITKQLKKHGFIHYEVSNFAKSGKYSLHNLTYWNNLEYYGFGCGASGYISGIRYDNPRSLSIYLNEEIKSENQILSLQSIMEYELILGLRKLEGIDINLFKNKYHVDIFEVFPISPLLKNNDLILEGNYLKINPKKIYVMNEILVKLV